MHSTDISLVSACAALAILGLGDTTMKKNFKEDKSLFPPVPFWRGRRGVLTASLYTNVHKVYHAAVDAARDKCN